jgi:hypothetical protein
MKNFLFNASNALNSSSKKAEDSITEKKDKYKSVLEMITDYGYPVEKHFYETEDHYINCVYRISGPRFSKPLENRKLVKPVVIY